MLLPCMLTEMYGSSQLRERCWQLKQGGAMNHITKADGFRDMGHTCLCQEFGNTEDRKVSLQDQQLIMP